MTIKFKSFYDFANAARDFVRMEDTVRTDCVVENLREEVSRLEEANARLTRDLERSVQPMTPPGDWMTSSAREFLHAFISRFDDDARRVLFDLHANAKIQQIKIIREVTGWGLKESKEFVEGSNPSQQF
jgi:hypothetical protein